MPFCGMYFVVGFKNTKLQSMKNLYVLLLLSFLSFNLSVFAQERNTFEEEFEPIRQELTTWDAVRGPWLAESMVAISNESDIPERTFPENFTPAQMLDVVPATISTRIRTLSAERSQTSNHGDRWQNVDGFVQRGNCRPVSGRSYGDPHVETFDGLRYSFQTVGEFTLARSNNGFVNVQTRQKAQNENFSLNTAVAMNVGGDRVGIYAEDFPDGDRSTPVRVNGVSVVISDRPYFLSRGGTIRRSRGMYVVDWPTGESVTAEIRNSGNMSFLNVTSNVYPCLHGGYNGVLGNANNLANDDFRDSRDLNPIRTAGIGSNDSFLERQRKAMIVRDFADNHRVDMATSLFDYPLGTSTWTFTDRTFPREHMSVDDLTPDRRTRAQNHCAQNGIRDTDMDGCIFDNAFLNLPPTPRHVVDDPTDGVRVEPLPRPIRNTNDNPATPTPRTPRTVFDAEENPAGEIDNPNNGAQPLIKDDNPVRQNQKDVEPKPVPTPRNPTTTPKVPSVKEPSTPRNPTPRANPTPRPSPVSPPKPSAPKPGPSSPIRGRG